MSAVSYAPQPDATQPAFVKGWHWVVAIFVPPLGAILGIIAMTKSQVGKGIGLLAVSTVSFVVALVILMSMAAAGSVAAVDSAVKDMEKAAATPSQVDSIAKGMTVGEVHKIMAPAKPNVQSESDFDGVGTSRIESYDVKDGKVFGKDVTITFDNGKVFSITKSDLG